MTLLFFLDYFIGFTLVIFGIYIHFYILLTLLILDVRSYLLSLLLLFMAKKKKIYFRDIFLEKHCIITKFLNQVLDVSSKVAENDACCIEHIISDETFEKMKAYLKDNE